jgi:hypothetical protein
MDEPRSLIHSLRSIRDVVYMYNTILHCQGWAGKREGTWWEAIMRGEPGGASWYCSLHSDLSLMNRVLVEQSTLLRKFLIRDCFTILHH